MYDQCLAVVQSAKQETWAESSTFTTSALSSSVMTPPWLQFHHEALSSQKKSTTNNTTECYSQVIAQDGCSSRAPVGWACFFLELLIFAWSSSETASPYSKGCSCCYRYGKSWSIQYTHYMTVGKLNLTYPWLTSLSGLLIFGSFPLALWSNFYLLLKVTALCGLIVPTRNLRMLTLGFAKP